MGSPGPKGEKGEAAQGRKGEPGRKGQRGAPGASVYIEVYQGISNYSSNYGKLSMTLK